MYTKTSFRLISATVISLILTACGGGKGSALDNTLSGTSSLSISSSTSLNQGSAGSGSSSAVDTTSPKEIGYGEGTSFQKGAIGINNTTSTLSAGGSALLTINVVSSTNNLVTSSVDITFNSPCVASGEAILESAGVVSNKVTATNGSATILYTANGCVGNDLITASASIGEAVKNATINIAIESDTIQSMKFIDVSEGQISLKGVGGNETSLVRFQVLGSTGAPIKDVDVDFALSTTIGGMKLTNLSSKTDKSGYAVTTIQAGTIHTAVRVTATSKTTNIFTTSDPITVSTGIPDQKSMSLSATDLFPIGWDIDGVESSINIRLGDAFNNPPPKGTAVAFTTEGGLVVDRCNTDEGGSCSVKWTSQNPKPTRNSPDETVERKLCVDSLGNWVSDYSACRLERAGRVTVLATSTGNESFIDKNGNGYFDSTDQFYNSTTGGDCSPNAPVLSAETPANSSTKPCDDLGEAYLDKDESFNHGDDEEFIDFTSALVEGTPDNAFSAGNGIYNGALCTSEGEAAKICTKNQVTIRRNLVLIMTSSQIMLRQGVLPFINPHLTSPLSTKFLLADANGHGAGAGTTLSVDNSNMTDGAASLSFTGPIAGSNDPIWIGVSVKPAEGKTPYGSFNIKIETKTILGTIISAHTISVN